MGMTEASLPTTSHRVLITGASGLLGRQVLRVFDEQGWSVRGLAFSRATGSLVKCDIFNHDDLQAQFEEFQPEVVVHCAAERRPDRLEGDEAYATKINVDAARSIGSLCQAHGAWLIFLSTNYVFDGKKAPYAEDAEPCPLSIYGQSKLGGERAVAEVTPESAVVRLPLLYGPIERLDETSVTSLLTTVRNEKDAKLDNWQERFPTNVEDVASVLVAMASMRMRCELEELELFQGVFHWQANERYTKYTMAKTIAEVANLDTSALVQVDAAPAPGSAPRPQFERMLCPRLERLLRIAADGSDAASAYRSDFRSSIERHLQPFFE